MDWKDRLITISLITVMAFKGSNIFYFEGRAGDMSPEASF